MAESRQLDINTFIAEGYLQEVNRRVLHPCGLALRVGVVNGPWQDDEPEVDPNVRKIADALSLYIEDDVEATAAAYDVMNALHPVGSAYLHSIWDYRDDPEGVIFVFFEEDRIQHQIKAQSVDDEIAARAKVRREIFGTDDYIQPLP